MVEYTRYTRAPLLLGNRKIVAEKQGSFGKRESSPDVSPALPLGLYRDSGATAAPRSWTEDGSFS